MRLSDWVVLNTRSVAHAKYSEVEPKISVKSGRKKMIFLSRFQDELTYMYMTAWSGVWVGAPFPARFWGAT